MALQHKLGNTSVGIPKLDATVFGSTENPVAMRSKCHTKDEILKDCQYSNASKSRHQHTLWPSKVRMHLPLGAAPGIIREGVVSSHILIVLSKLPLTRRSPEGAKATL